MQFFHRSNDSDLNEIEEGGRFGGLFALDSDPGEIYGRYLYSIDVAGAVMSDDEISSSFYKHDPTEFFTRFFGYKLSDDEFVVAERIVKEDFSDMSSKVFSDLFGFDGDAIACCQKLRGAWAKHLGASAVTITDEFGGSAILIIDKNCVIKKEGKI